MLHYAALDDIISTQETIKKHTTLLQPPMPLISSVA